MAETVENVAIGDVLFTVVDGIARITADGAFRAVGFSKDDITITEH